LTAVVFVTYQLKPFITNVVCYGVQVLAVSVIV